MFRIHGYELPWNKLEWLPVYRFERDVNGPGCRQRLYGYDLRTTG